MAIELAHGSKVFYAAVPSGATSPVWTEIKNLDEIPLPVFEVEEVDVTSHSSRGKRKFINGLENSTDSEINGIYEQGDTAITALEGYKTAGTEILVKYCLFPDDIKAANSADNDFDIVRAFRGKVKSVALTAPVDGTGTFAITFKFDDTYTIT